MHRLLHVIGSPGGERSRTRAVAEHFIATLARLRPELEVETIDPWQEDLPPFDAEMVQAKFAVLRKQEATAAQRALWERAARLARRFNAADIHVIGVPMWNFGLPYRLKHFIDVVTLPEQNWRWTPATGYESLLTGKQAVVVYSSAGDYPLDPLPADHQKGLLREWLRFVGVRDVTELNVAPTLAPPGKVFAALDTARRRAEEAAARLAL